MKKALFYLTVFAGLSTTGWMLITTAPVLLMILCLAMFYGGLVRTQNVIGTMMHTLVAPTDDIYCIRTGGSGLEAI